jgi:hypothetical protein
MKNPFIYSIFLIFHAGLVFSLGNESYYQLAVELPQSVSKAINIDALHKYNGMKMSSARLLKNKIDFPVRYEGLEKTENIFTYIFDIPLGIDEVNEGETATVVMPLHAQYIGIPCTSIIKKTRLSGPSILVIKNNRLKILAINLIKKLQNNVCLAKSSADLDLCVVDQPTRFKKSDGSYKVPINANCGYRDLRPTLITLQGVIRIAQ